MEAEKANHSTVLMARVLNVSRSGFYGWRRRGSDRNIDRECRIEAVKTLHRAKRGSLGSRRMATRLQRRGCSVGRYQARSLMREAGVVCRQRRRKCLTTIADQCRPVAPNRLARRFDVAAPNRVWCADITAVWTLQGWLYLAAVLDLGDRQVVGWAMADHMRTALVMQALNMALGRRRPNKGLLHHSDSKNTAIRFSRMT